MGLLSYFQRKSKPSAEAPASAEPDAVAAARTRARRRLIGATVLLGVGIIGFPLLFETQPRPVVVDIPIEIPRKDGLPPLQLPPAAPLLTPTPAALLDEAPPPAVQAPAAPVPAGAAKPAAEIVERASDQGRELTPAAAVSAVAPRPATVPPAPVAAASRPGLAKPAPDDGARIRALLDGQASAPAPVARTIVQVGAYGDAARLAEARQKVEKLGLKTYTQVVESDGVKRTRVRVGPFATRAEADKAAARIKSAGLPVAILTL